MSDQKESARWRIICFRPAWFSREMDILENLRFASPNVLSHAQRQIDQFGIRDEVRGVALSLREYARSAPQWAWIKAADEDTKLQIFYGLHGNFVRDCALSFVRVRT